MNYSQILPIDEFKIRATILLKSLKKNDSINKDKAAERFKIIPELNNISVSEIINNKDSIKLKHALRVLALENGFSSWENFKEFVEYNNKNQIKEKNIFSFNKSAKVILTEEFKRQVNNLLEKGYHNICGLSKEEFLDHINPLKEKIIELSITNNKTQNNIPFIIVIQNDLISTEEAMSLIVFKGKKGFTVIEREDIKKFKNIESLDIPNTMIYLLVDIDTGKETLNITPNDAFEIIKKQNSSPLTIWEGIALITHYPEILKTNNCFSLLGSRCGDKRVTALWLSKSQPKLGWCWAGNPHTWLGSASCKYRI